MSNAPVSTVSLLESGSADYLCSPCKHNKEGARRDIEEVSVVFWMHSHRVIAKGKLNPFL